MLERLHQIVQEVNAARGLGQALNIIVQRVAEATGVDVCSIYLVDQETGEYVLMATLGLNPTAVGQVRLGVDEGLVGLVGERAEPINLNDADQHPRFRYFPETGEERFHSFLGVPIIHFRKLLGVLVVQQQARRRFGDAEVAFLMTVAAQLAGAIAHGEASGGIDGLQEGGRRGSMLLGVPGSVGVAQGTAMVVYASADLNAVPDRWPDDTDAEIELFLACVEAVREELRGISERLTGSIAAEEHHLFDAYLRMLDSDSLIKGTIEQIRAGNWAPGALRETIGRHVQVFNEMEDPYLRERASDVRDIGRRILMRLQLDSGDERVLPDKVILVGREVSASQLAEIEPERLAGLVTARGSGNSHAAILARAFGVPAVMGVGELPVGRLDGRSMIVDGYSGRVYVDPSAPVRREYRRLMREEAELSAGLKSLQNLPAETPDGFKVSLYANTGLLSDINSSLNSGCDGIGLHRTEFPFMVRDRFPGEEEQTDIYRRVLEPFKGRPVVLRTLDVGGDKSLPYFPVREDNPFLGWRGIRLTLDHPEIFLSQLRAMLRADVGVGNLQIMFPMISRLDEVDQALVLLRRALAELLEEGYAVEMPKVGVMIEVPAAVFQIDALAQRVDFLSVGTNDLTQYLLAVDRNNPRVANLYDELHPAVIRALQLVAESGRRYGKPVSVCGSMAGDPAAVILLLAMGVDGLSTSVASLPRIKWVVRTIAQSRARQLLSSALELDTPKEIRALLTGELEGAGLGGLVRAGK
jgi:phosphotransferase system, enzyme I, PtsP